MRESDLYAPIKLHLESLGYTVKAEVKSCDVVAIKGDDEMVIVELKLAFSLDLVLQAVDRKGLGDNVYTAVPAPTTPTKRKNWKSKRRETLKLCKMLGLGLIFVNLEKDEGQQVEVLVDPAPYKPRPNKKHQTRLKKEFKARTGDPNTGGVTRRKIITAYRQDALRCLNAMKNIEEIKLAELRKSTGVEKAGTILQKNHYGWFERKEQRGYYGITDAGKAALKQYKDVIKELG